MWFISFLYLATAGLICIDDGDDESHWQDRVSSGFDRLVEFASIELTKSRRSVEDGAPSTSPDSGINQSSDGRTFLSSSSSSSQLDAPTTATPPHQRAVPPPIEPAESIRKCFCFAICKPIELNVNHFLSIYQMQPSKVHRHRECHEHQVRHQAHRQFILIVRKRRRPCSRIWRKCIERRRVWV